jgi:hypothetical protein
MQEAVTLKPNWKLCNKKKVWGPRKLNFKAVGAITVFPKKSQIRKNDKNVKEFHSFTYTEEKIGMQATRNYSLPSGEVAIPKIYVVCFQTICRCISL